MSLWDRLRRFWALWGFAAFCVLVVALFYQVVLPFILALMLAYVLAPVVTRLARLRVFGRTVPRGAAVIVCYVGILGALGLFLGAFLPRLSGDVARLFREAPVFFAKVKTEYVPRASAWVEEHFPSSEEGGVRAQGPAEERRLTVTQTAPGRYSVSLEAMDLQVEAAGKGRWVVGPRRDSDAPPGRVEDIMERLARAGETESMELLKLGQRFVAGAVTLLAKFALVFMVAAFILVDTSRVKEFLRGLVPPQHRGDFDVVIVEMDRGLSGVIRGQLLICLVNGVLTYVGLLIFKVKYSLLLGMLAGAMSLIPVLGSILSSIPIVLIAMVSATPGSGGLSIARGFAVLAWIVGIHLIEANYLNPKIIGESAKIHPVVVVFALLVGEHTGGLAGALIAVPIASIVQTMFLFLRRRADDGLPRVAA